MNRPATTAEVPSHPLPPGAGPPRSVAPDAPEPEPRSEDGLRVSEEVYWRDYYELSDRHYEWNDGRLEEKPVSDYGTYLVYAWFIQVLQRFLHRHPMARMIALEMGFRMVLPTGVVIRKPDFAVVRNDNPRPLRTLDRSYPGVFDLCVEALSDEDQRGALRDTLTKKTEYAAGGVPEYFILHREPRHQTFFTRTTGGLYVPIAPVDGVIHSRVLPGFRFRLADLCRQPDPEDLRADPVYADFMFPGYREAEARAESEARRVAAEVEARRAAERQATAEARRATAEAQRAAAEAQARQAAEQRAAAEADARREAERRAEAEAQARRRLEEELAALRAQAPDR